MRLTHCVIGTETLSHVVGVLVKTLSITTGGAVTGVIAELTVITIVVLNTFTRVGVNTVYTATSV